MEDKKGLVIERKKGGVDSACPEIPPRTECLYTKKHAVESINNEKLKKKIGIGSSELLSIPRGAP